MIVLVAGAGVSVTVSMIVAPACPSTPVAAAGPPSTGTTEYVALPTNGSKAAFRPKNGNDEPNEKSEETAKRVGVDVLSRIVILSEGMKTWSQGLILAVRNKDEQSIKRKLYRDQEMHHDICGFPTAMLLQEVGVLRNGWCLRVKAVAGRQAHSHQNGLRLCFTL
jgi:hypothetical protein